MGPLTYIFSCIKPPSENETGVKTDKPQLNQNQGISAGVSAQKGEGGRATRMADQARRA